RGMQAGMGYDQSLRERGALLEGLDARVLYELAENLPLTEGAETLLKVLKRLGYRTAVISGGFSIAAEALQERLGIDFAWSNTLEISPDGKLTGRVLGPIVNAQRKADILVGLSKREGVPLDQVIAIGDGANDLLMLQKAGHGIAFHAKPSCARPRTPRSARWASTRASTCWASPAAPSRRWRAPEDPWETGIDRNCGGGGSGGEGGRGGGAVAAGGGFVVERPAGGGAGGEGDDRRRGPARRGDRRGQHRRGGSQRHDRRLRRRAQRGGRGPARRLRDARPHRARRRGRLAGGGEEPDQGGEAGDGDHRSHPAGRPRRAPLRDDERVCGREPAHRKGAQGVAVLEAEPLRQRQVAGAGPGALRPGRE